MTEAKWIKKIIVYHINKGYDETRKRIDSMLLGLRESTGEDARGSAAFSREGSL